MKLRIFGHKIHRITYILFNRFRTKVRRVLLSQKKISPIFILGVTLYTIVIWKDFSTICWLIVDIRKLQMIFRLIDWFHWTLMCLRHDILFCCCFFLKSICCVFVIILYMNITHLTGLGWGKETIFVIDF